jgi:hypothetical protein
MKRSTVFLPCCLFFVSLLACGSNSPTTEPDDAGAMDAQASDANGKGACLLEYNTALASGDPCCYRKGGANTCNKAITCNEASGAGCCLIYGTDNTAGGERCCLYSDGGSVDSAAECAQLLSAR